MLGCESLRAAGALRTVGDRVEISFDGLRMGLLQGAIAYTFFPGSRLIQSRGEDGQAGFPLLLLLLLLRRSHYYSGIWGWVVRMEG
jgi:hypothetical protein